MTMAMGHRDASASVDAILKEDVPQTQHRVLGDGKMLVCLNGTPTPTQAASHIRNVRHHQFLHLASMRWKHGATEGESTTKSILSENRPVESPPYDWVSHISGIVRVYTENCIKHIL